MKKAIKSILLLLSFSLYACINLVPLGKGNLSTGATYSYLSFKYIEIKEKSTQNGSTKVFFSSIKQSKTVVEKIVYYNAATPQPFKISYTYDINGGLIKKDYFVCVSDANPTILLSEIEKQLLVIMADKNESGDYVGYKTITGFRQPNEHDNLQKLPFLKDVENNRRN